MLRADHTVDCMDADFLWCLSLIVRSSLAPVWIPSTLLAPTSNKKTVDRFLVQWDESFPEQPATTSLSHWLLLRQLYSKCVNGLLLYLDWPLLISSCWSEQRASTLLVGWWQPHVKALCVGMNSVGKMNWTCSLWISTWCDSELWKQQRIEWSLDHFNTQMWT